MLRLGVNIDHVATIRQARRTIEPDPVWAAALAELGGADVLTVHLREDRRHIQPRDVRVLRETSQIPLNLEMAATTEMLEFCLSLRPHQATLVPEKREEVTTEGGLDVAGNIDRIRECCQAMQQQGIVVSLFIDPDARQIVASRAAGATAIEIHTGQYADARTNDERQRVLTEIETAARLARSEHLNVHAGHGLTYRNVRPVAAIPDIEELNIGHSIVSRAVLVGMDRAVREMKAEMAAARMSSQTGAGQ